MRDESEISNVCQQNTDTKKRYPFEYPSQIPSQINEEKKKHELIKTSPNRRRLDIIAENQ